MDTFIINSAGEIIDSNQEFLEEISERFEDLNVQQASIDYE